MTGIERHSAPDEVPAGTDERRRLRGFTSGFLLLLGCIVAVTSVLVVFARNEVLNTNTYLKTVTPLAAEPAVQHAIAQQVSTRLVASTNLQRDVKRALPARAGFLAAPVAAAVQSTAYNVTLNLVRSAAFQHLWLVANRATHTQVVHLLTGAKQGALSSSGGKITVDLAQIEGQARQALAAKGITVFDKVPTNSAPVLVLFRPSDLAKLQGLIRLLNKVSVLLPIISILCLALAVMLRRNRRQGLCRVALGLALSMALLLIAASIGRSHYIDSLRPDSRAVAAAVIDTLSAVVLDTARTILMVALLVALVTVMAGSAELRQALRRRRRRPTWLTVGPVPDAIRAHRALAQWGVFALGVLVLVLWNEPTAFVAIITSLVTMGLVGLVGLMAGRSPYRERGTR